MHHGHVVVRGIACRSWLSVTMAFSLWFQESNCGSRHLQRRAKAGSLNTLVSELTTKQSIHSLWCWHKGLIWSRESNWIQKLAPNKKQQNFTSTPPGPVDVWQVCLGHAVVKYTVLVNSRATHSRRQPHPIASHSTQKLTQSRIKMEMDALN